MQCQKVATMGIEGNDAMNVAALSVILAGDFLLGRYFVP
jgi:hypothetical protein